MSKFLVYYYGEPYVVEAETIENALRQFSKYPEGVTMIIDISDESVTVLS